MGHWHEFIRDAFRAMQGHPRGENVFEAMADILSQQFRVLLLDELVITHISEAILVKNLFRHLWARGITIITTSNYLPEELYAKGFNRDQFEGFIPDIHAQMPVHHMGGEVDYRKIDTGSGSSFYHPLGDDSTAKLTQDFDAMIGGTSVKDFALPVPQENRNIIVPSHGTDVRGAKVARFSFDDLCVQNRGRADYATIAEHFHHVFIDNVPKFKNDLGAEFRRFVSFTDIMYGKRVALHMTCEVSVDDVFAASMTSPDVDLDELWAFRRCSSMLSEMQSDKYHHMVWLMRNHLLQESAMHL